MKPITEEMINIFHNNLESAQEANKKQKIVDITGFSTRVQLLKEIKEMREKGFEPQTILETIENKLKFDK